MTTATVSQSGLRRDLFGLQRVPFTAAAPCYLDPARADLLAKASAFLQRRGFAFLGGPPGAGKTRLLQHVCSLPDPRSVQLAYLPFAMCRDRELLRALALAFRLETPYRKSALLRLLQEHALSLGAAVTPILVIDEAQLLDAAALDTLRVLANHTFESQNLFAIFLVGHDEFRERLSLRVHEPLRQRLAACWHLAAFDREHTLAYVEHHLRHAGAEHALFAPEALHRLYDQTRGVPRLINHLALAALEAASARTSPTVTLADLDTASDTLPDTQPRETTNHAPRPA